VPNSSNHAISNRSCRSVRILEELLAVANASAVRGSFPNRSRRIHARESEQGGPGDSQCDANPTCPVWPISNCQPRRTLGHGHKDSSPIVSLTSNFSIVDCGRHMIESQKIDDDVASADIRDVNVDPFGVRTKRQS
jgi:hypothetical protein